MKTNMTRNKLSLIIIFSVLWMFLASNQILAANITIDLTIIKSEDNYFLRVNNIGEDELRIKGIKYFFNGRERLIKTDAVLLSGQQELVKLEIEEPAVKGSYNLYCKLYYLNDGIMLSVVSNDIFDFGVESRLNFKSEISKETFNRSLEITARIEPEDYLDNLQFILPEELEISRLDKKDNGLLYHLIYTTPEFSNNYTAYLIIDKIETINGESVHSAGYNKTTVSAEYVPSILKSRYLNFLSFKVMSRLFLILIFLLLVFLYKYARSKTCTAEIYYVFSLLVFILLVCIFQFPGLFRGRDYTPFRNVILPVYFIGVMSYLTFSFFKLRRLQPEALHQELADKKMWLVFSFLYGLFHRRKSDPSGKSSNWTPRTRTAFLSLLVKFFFLPLLWSWTVAHSCYLYYGLGKAHFDFYTFNKFLIILFILVDTSIFAFSYSIESKKLNSEIKSVEPTFLGWMVCLWCYPPFNKLSFVWMDVIIPVRSNFHLSNTGLMVVSVVIVLLWILYLSATIALGFKASNLTNRGIVAKGPYAFIRHPAYISKPSIWFLEFLFFSDKYLGGIIVAFIIYHLRSLTEERHLGMDPAYKEYMKKVKYRYMPFLF